MGTVTRNTLRDKNLRGAQDDPDIAPFIHDVLGDVPTAQAAPSIARFCHFVNACMRSARDPRAITGLCEQQAEALRVRPTDVTPENLSLLLDTLLNTIDRLERSTNVQADTARPTQQTTPHRTIRLSRQRPSGMTTLWAMGKMWLHRLSHGRQPVTT